MRAERFYFLDWLRILALALLIMFHVGLMYTNWEYVFKSPRLIPAMEWVLAIFYPWRILLIFFISGVACRFLIDKLGALAFARDRAIRLLPVLLVGTLVLNPVQNYFELVSQGAFSGGYIDFWTNYYLMGSTSFGRILPTWDHLWFLVYLLVYALSISLIHRFTKNWINHVGGSGRVIKNLILALFPLLAIFNILVVEIQPATFDLIHDWGVHLRSIAIFLAGFVFGKSHAYWLWTRHNRHRLLVASLLLLIGMLLLQVAAEVADLKEYLAFLIAGISGAYAWASILTLVAYFSDYVDINSQSRAYLTEAILPVYVLHQPIMIAIAFCLFPLHLAACYEGALILLCTTVFCFVFYEAIIKRFRVMRFVFGLK